MTLRLVYSRPIADYVTNDQPQASARPALFRSLARWLLEALRYSRAKAAMRELRRYQHLVHKDGDADKT
jgi:hypothetical protein